MTPRPGTDQTASSANSPRRASPSFLANASKIRRTIAAFSAADTALLPAGDESLDVPALGVRERGECDEAARFVWVVVRDGCLEVLTLWRGLAELSPQPPQQAHGCLIRHGGQAILGVIKASPPRPGRRR